MKRSSIAVIGSLNYDFILKSARLPVKGETLVADSVSYCGGGKGANQAVQCSRLGLPTFMVGALGDDFMGDSLRAGLVSCGLDVSAVKTVAGPSGQGYVMAASDGSVMASIVRGANYAVTRDDIDRAVPLMEKSSCVVLQLEIPVDVVEYAMRKASDAGCRVVLNAAPACPVSEDSLRLCDVFVVNEVEAAFYAGRPITGPRGRAPDGLRALFSTGMRDLS